MSNLNLTLSNQTVVHAPTPHNEIAVLYIFGLCTVGLSVHHLYEKRSNWRSPFFFLPVTTLITALCFIIIDLNRYFVVHSPDSLNAMTVAQFALDYPSSIAIDVAYFLRLRVVLKAEKAWSGNTIILYASYGLLLIPVSWIVPDAIGILSVYYLPLSNISIYFFGVWNIGLAVNELIMHVFFVHHVLTKIPSVKSNTSARVYLFGIAVILSVNSLILLSGGITNIFDPQIGTTLIYSSWITNVWVFLALNEAVGTVLGRSKEELTKTPTKITYATN